MEKIRVKANAKINLCLDVTSKREDGYHNIESIMQEIDLYDEITIKKGGDGIRLSVDKSDLSEGEDNLVFKAAKLMKEEYGLKEGLDISLKKNIPTQAGMGGGSADAAWTLKGINELFELGLSYEKLAVLGKKLGADVPFLIYGGTAFTEGIGEKITPMKLKNKMEVIIVKPQISVSTKEAYRLIDENSFIKHPDSGKAKVCLEKGDFKGFVRAAGNLFEDVIIPLEPLLSKIKATLKNDYKFDYVLMSGSGPTIAAIKENPDYDFDKLKASFKDCQVFKTSTV